MKLLRNLVIILLTSCGGRTPDYISGTMVEYYLDPDVVWNWQQVERQEQGFIEALTDGSYIYTKDRVLESLSGVKVYIHKDILSCDWVYPGAKCDGYFGDDEINVSKNTCPYDSALTHEMGHRIQKEIKDWRDSNHVETDLWMKANNQYGKCY
jgi:hypothetical protein